MVRHAYPQMYIAFEVLETQQHKQHKSLSLYNALFSQIRMHRIACTLDRLMKVERTGEQDALPN